MKLLHIDSSILGASGASRRLTAAIVDRLRSEIPAVEVRYRDLVAEPLPHLTQGSIPKEHPFSAAAENAEDARELTEFLESDIAVIGVPMYNFTIPSQLKAWIDRIVVPRRTFSYGPEGAKGLAGGKRVILAITRGGFFGSDTPYAVAEHAESYLRVVFRFIGVENLQVILAEGLMVGAAQSEAAMTSALRVASELR